MFRPILRAGLLAGVSALALAGPAAAQLVASANDGKARLVNGATVIANPPSPDSVTVLDLGASPPRVVAQGGADRRAGRQRGAAHRGKVTRRFRTKSRAAPGGKGPGPIRPRAAGFA